MLNLGPSLQKQVLYRCETCFDLPTSDIKSLSLKCTLGEFCEEKPLAIIILKIEVVIVIMKTHIQC